MASYILPSEEIRPFEQQFRKLQQATGNEGLLLCGLPSIRRCDDPMQFVGTRIALSMLPKHPEQESQQEVKPSKNTIQQLTLFDM